MAGRKRKVAPKGKAGLDHEPLTTCRSHKDRLADLTRAVEDSDVEVEAEDREQLLETFRYALDHVEQHYKNLVHCYAIAEGR